DITLSCCISVDGLNEVYFNIYAGGTLGTNRALLDSGTWSSPGVFKDRSIVKVTDAGPDGFPLYHISFTYNFSDYPGTASILIRPLKDNGFSNGSLYVYYVGITETPYPAHPIPTNGTAVTVAGDSCSL